MQGLIDAAKRWSGESAMLGVALCYVLLSAWAATTFGFHSAFGALVAAVNLSRRHDLLELWQRRFSGLADPRGTVELMVLSIGLQLRLISSL